jgi:rhamnogalacturonan endolyase
MVAQANANHGIDLQSYATQPPGTWELSIEPPATAPGVFHADSISKEFLRRVHRSGEAFMRNLFFLGTCAAWLAGAISTVAAPNQDVRITDGAWDYVLNNGVVSATVNKRSGDLVSLKYRGLEMLGAGSGHPFGYWSHAPGREMRVTNAITLHPDANGGERAEVSIKGFYSGTRSSRAAGGPGGSTACDIEIRYTLARGDSGIYTCSIFTHETNHPATGIGEARFGAKLNPDVFDHMTIDARRNKRMPRPEDWDQGTELNFKEARRLNTGIYAGQVEHKYDYSAIQFRIPAFGWSSTQQRVGFWFINPSIEYLSGGATKVELTGHLDNNEGGAPTLLNYWRGSHYGGSICAIGEGERWSKVIGPFLIYCNNGSDPNAMWRDALNRATREARDWPYDWVQGVDYPHRKERGTVKGRVVLNDSYAPDLVMSNILVGLAAPDYPAPRFDRPGNFPALNLTGGGEDEARTNGVRAALAESVRAENRGAVPGAEVGPRRGRGFGGPRVVDWQNDAKYYQFWVQADERGRFTIPKVRPGTYTLHVIADGVLGEAVREKVTVVAGRTLDLDQLQWTPLRFGRPLWEVGIPNRSGEEFRHGDHYWRWGLYYQYTNDFPNDVHFVIGQSDPRKDWNYVQTPRSSQEGTTWSIAFHLTNAPQGRATLRLGIAGISLRQGIQVSVNGNEAGSTPPLADTATIRRDGIRGYWSERNVAFDGSLLRAGTNVLQLSIPPGGPTSGVIYDYVRLELDDRHPR